MAGPVGLAEQVTGFPVASPGAPGLGQGDGRGVPFGGPFLRGAGVLVGGGPQMFGFRFDPEHLLLRLGEPPGFG
jgi:hypothetical protein